VACTAAAKLRWQTDLWSWRPATRVNYAAAGGLYSRRHQTVKIWASCRVAKTSRFRSSSRSLPLNDSMKPFSQGDPGSMNGMGTPSSASPP